MSTDLLRRHPRPWTTYTVRAHAKAPVNEVQVRDANGAVVLVSARYGEHAFAPLNPRDRVELAEFVVEAVNAFKE